MDNQQHRPKCKICLLRQADFLPKRSDGTRGFRETCSLCRRRENHEALRYAENKKSWEGMVDHVRPICKKCNRNLAARQSTRFGLKADKTPYYHSICGACRRKTIPQKDDYHLRGYRKAAFRHAGPDPKCSYCGFEPLHIGQLDVDHINGNHNDHRLENLQILCSNCHRLKTILAADDRQWVRARREKLTDPNNFKGA